MDEKGIIKVFSTLSIVFAIGSLIPYFYTILFIDGAVMAGINAVLFGHGRNEANNNGFVSNVIGNLIPLLFCYVGFFKTQNCHQIIDGSFDDAFSFHFYNILHQHE